MWQAKNMKLNRKKECVWRDIMFFFFCFRLLLILFCPCQICRADSALVFCRSCVWCFFCVARRAGSTLVYINYIYCVTFTLADRFIGHPQLYRFRRQCSLCTTTFKCRVPNYVWLCVGGWEKYKKWSKKIKEATHKRTYIPYVGVPAHTYTRIHNRAGARTYTHAATNKK